MSLLPFLFVIFCKVTADAAHGSDEGGLLNKLLDLVDKYVYIRLTVVDVYCRYARLSISFEVVSIKERVFIY